MYISLIADIIGPISLILTIIITISQYKIKKDIQNSYNAKQELAFSLLKDKLDNLTSLSIWLQNYDDLNDEILDTCDSQCIKPFQNAFDSYYSYLPNNVLNESKQIIDEITNWFTYASSTVNIGDKNYNHLVISTYKILDLVKILREILNKEIKKAKNI